MFVVLLFITYCDIAMSLKNNKPEKMKIKAQSYKKHIIIILLVKAVLFTGIWYFFFQNPIELNDKQAFQGIFFKK